MTRKRFVKLAMSFGWGRNGANYLAKMCSEDNIPYSVGATPLEGHAVRGTEGLVRYFFRLCYKKDIDET